MDPDAVNISRFKSYHHYLDSLIAEEDIRYLQDGELARLIGLTVSFSVSISYFISPQLSSATAGPAAH